ncbi:hypothetical protein CR513_33100, partial [Mucuna pruriens]
MHVKNWVTLQMSVTIIKESKKRRMKRKWHKSFITNVLYVLQMKTNMLSLGQLLEKGYVINMEHNMMKTRNSFKSNILETKGLLEVVYSDVCGPMKSVSLGGSHYFISFVDDFSRKLWVYLIKRKGEAFVVQGNGGETMWLIHQNDGGEYISHDIHSYCDKEGIIHEVIAPYIP